MLLNKSRIQAFSTHFEKEITTHLYSWETARCYSFKSHCLQLNVEMVKYYLIFDIYKNCKKIGEIVDAIREKAEVLKSIFVQNFEQKKPAVAPSKPVNNEENKIVGSENIAPENPKPLVSEKAKNTP